MSSNFDTPFHPILMLVVWWYFECSAKKRIVREK